MSIQPDKFTVADVMIKADGVPQTAPTTLLKEALEEMDAKRLGIICIVDNERQLCGLITDGDIRRMLTRVQKPFAALMSDDVINHAITNPTTVTKDMSLREAVAIMGQKQVWDLPVVSNDGILEGLLHLHPAIKILMKDISDD